MTASLAASAKRRVVVTTHFVSPSSTDLVRISILFQTRTASRIASMRATPRIVLRRNDIGDALLPWRFNQVGQEIDPKGADIIPIFVCGALNGFEIDGFEKSFAFGARGKVNKRGRNFIPDILCNIRVHRESVRGEPVCRPQDFELCPDFRCYVSEGALDTATRRK